MINFKELEPHNNYLPPEASEVVQKSLWMFHPESQLILSHGADKQGEIIVD
jgi:hypothetical protein